KHWGLRKSRNATSLNSRFKSLDTLKVKIISVTFRRVIRTNHKKASKIWRHENIQLRSEERRVGKECRFRSTPNQETKNRKSRAGTRWSATCHCERPCCLTSA